MEPEELDKFCIVIEKLADIYYQKLTKQRIFYYWNILNKFTLAEILLACRKHIYGQHGNFMPKPADIIKKITRIKSQILIMDSVE